MKRKTKTALGPIQILASGSKSNSNPDHELMDLVETEEPSLYNVLLLNDDYTPMDFVIYVLIHFFNHSELTAAQIMMDVHTKGSGVAGTFSFEVAETKSSQVNQFAKSNQHPLKSIIEEEK